MVAWPQTGTSLAGVKKRTCTSYSPGFPGKRNAVSELFSSRAMRRISSSVRPRASSTTPAGLPESFSLVKAST